MAKTLNRKARLALRIVEANLHNLADVASVVILACKAADEIYDALDRRGWITEYPDEEE